MFKKIMIFLIIGVLLSISFDLVAQCPMCRMTAESNLQNGGSAGKGLNKGILYILAMPYLLVFTGVFIWRRSQREHSQEH